MRILIVDDDHMICDGNARRIVRMAFPQIEEVKCAYSGEAAVEMLKNERFDAMLTDIRMTKMDGLQLIQIAREINPHLICIVITAFDRFQYAQQALRLGVEDFLVKPLSEQSMRKHIENVIAKYQRSISEKDSRLELEICAQVVSGEADIDACFRQCGIRSPECPVCMVVWSELGKGDVLEELDGLWKWQPTSGHFLLVEWKEKETLRCLNAVCRSANRFAGVSAPGKNLKEMAAQAEKALEFAWAVENPSAVCWTKQQGDAFLETRHRLLAQVRAQNASAVQHILNNDAIILITQENIEHIRIVPAGIRGVKQRFSVALQNIIVTETANAAVLCANRNKCQIIHGLCNAILHQMKRHARAFRMLHHAVCRKQRLAGIGVSVDIQNGQRCECRADLFALFGFAQILQLRRHAARPQKFRREVIHVRMRHQNQLDFCGMDAQIRHHGGKVGIHINQTVIIHQRTAVAADIPTAQEPRFCAIWTFTPKSGVSFTGARSNKSNFHLCKFTRVSCIL